MFSAFFQNAPINFSSFFTFSLQINPPKWSAFRLRLRRNWKSKSKSNVWNGNLKERELTCPQNVLLNVPQVRVEDNKTWCCRTEGQRAETKSLVFTKVPLVSIHTSCVIVKGVHGCGRANCGRRRKAKNFPCGSATARSEWVTHFENMRGGKQCEWAGGAAVRASLERRRVRGRSFTWSYSRAPG